MVRNNLFFGSNELHSVAKAYINIVNDISSFVKPTPPANIITNETILQQYSIKQGLNFFGNKDEAEVRKELHEFYDSRVVESKKPQELSYEQRRRSIAYLMFLKLKSNEVKIKGRHSVVKAYINIVNAIAYFITPTPPTNIITNETILTQ